LELASKNTNPLASLARVFTPLTYPFYIFGKDFSDVVSENTVLKNLSTSLVVSLPILPPWKKRGAAT
jgi:hypothetical protein